MGGCTIIVDGKTLVEMLEKMTEQMRLAEESGLWLDSGISIIEKVRVGGRIKTTRLGGVATGVYDVYAKKEYKNFEGFIGICHVHS